MVSTKRRNCTIAHTAKSQTITCTFARSFSLQFFFFGDMSKRKSSNIGQKQIKYKIGYSSMEAIQKDMTRRVWKTLKNRLHYILPYFVGATWRMQFLKLNFVQWQLFDFKMRQ